MGAWKQAGDEVVILARKGDIPPGWSKAIEAFGIRLALFNVDGRYYAVSGNRPGMVLPLSEREWEERLVLCWASHSTGLAPHGLTGRSIAVADLVQLCRIEIMGDEIRLRKVS